MEEALRSGKEETKVFFWLKKWERMAEERAEEKVINWNKIK